MMSLSPTTPTLPSYNPSRQLSIPHQLITQGIFRRYSCDTAISHDKDEKDHLLPSGFSKRKSRLRNFCGYTLLALVSLISGMVAGHFIHTDDNLNEYLSTLNLLSTI
jgi:hypothetical protein